MINSISSIEDAERVIRSALIDAGGLSDEYVINALSAYGADLATVFDDYQSSIAHPSASPEEERDEAIVIFETRCNTDSKDNCIDCDVIHQAYTMHVTIYGDRSDSLARKIKAYLLDIDSKLHMQIHGVHISSVSNIESKNEFKNEVMWQRRDFDIGFSVRF